MTNSSLNKNLLKTCALSLATSLCLCLTCAAEYNVATKQEEHLLFSTASEVKLGLSLAQQIEKKYKRCPDQTIQERVDKIGQKLVAVCDRKDITYSFVALEGEKVNAFALPGGYVYINKGVIDKVSSDDEIASVLAHEIGHLVARHSIKRLQSALGYNLISILALAATKDVRFKRGIDSAFNQIMLGYAREDEILADKLAVKYLQKADYEPQAVISFLNKLKQIEKEAPLEPLTPSFARTHPYLPERIAAVKQEVYGKMDFDDYINRREQITENR